MRVLFYVEPLVERENPNWKAPWVQYFVKKISTALLAEGLAEEDLACLVPTALEAAAREVLPGSRVGSIDQTELIPRFGGSALAVASTWYKNAASEKALFEMSELVKERIGDFSPTCCITFSPAPYLRTAWPDTRLLHMEYGFLSRPPFPETVYFDSYGMFSDSALARFAAELREREPSEAERALLSDVRERFCKFDLVEQPNPLADLVTGAVGQFESAILLALQFSNFYAYDANARFTDQYDLLVHTLESVPRTVAVVVCEHPEHLVLSPQTTAYLRSRYPNFVWHPLFRQVNGASHYLMPFVQGVVTVSSSVGLQALLWRKKLAVIGGGHLAAVSDTCEVSDLPPLLGGAWAENKDRILCWLLSSFHLPFDVLLASGRLARYFEALTAGKVCTIEEAPACVGLDIAKLREFYDSAWNKRPMSPYGTATILERGSFVVALYVASEGRPYDERCCLRRFVSQLSNEEVCLSFVLDRENGNPISLRLDPMNRSGFLQMHELVLLDVRGEILWKWQGGYIGIRACQGVGIVSTLKGGLLVCDNDDPQIELDIDFSLYADVPHPLAVQVRLASADFSTVLMHLSERDGQITYLNQVVAAHEGRIADLNRGLTEQEGQIADLNRGLTKREGQIADLNRGLTEQEGQIADLNRGLTKREGQIADLNRGLTERDEQIETLQDHINQLLMSRSWKLTKPLRALGKLARRSTPHSLGGIVISQAEVSQQGASTPPSELSNNACDFDPDFYLKMYPDIAVSGVNPAEHFRLYGQQEGRIGCPPDLDFDGRFESFDNSRETVIVVSHEASLTGAPILSLNLVQGLASRYNVVAMLLGGGAIESAFKAEGVVVVRAFSARAHTFMAASVLESILEHCSVKFALVNSIESRAVLPALAKWHIPAITLIHEFAAYTRPKEAFREVFYWSAETVFSSSITIESAWSELPDLTGKTSCVLPQGRCVLPSVEHDPDRLARDRQRIRDVFHPQSMTTKPFVVLGAGFVQLRKGIDLFIECASRVVRSAGGEHCRFVWIGGGFDAERDTGYSVYLADQIRRSGLEQTVFFLGETLAIETAYEKADILLLSSRLDPLPNVAIDALVHGLPVLCFDKTTGIAEILAEEGLAPTCVAGYLDTHDMAQKIVAMATSKALRDDVGARSRVMAQRRFDMDSYVEALEQLALEACARKKQERVDIDEIARSGRLRTDFVGGGATEEVVLRYVRGWATGIGRRKPQPGFHPGIYQELHGVSIADSDPFADYLRSGRPDGPWIQEVIAPPISKVNSLPEGTRVALHLHVYYPELLGDMLERLQLNALRPDLFVSVPDDAARQHVIGQLQDYQGKVVSVAIVPNRGRDIGPLLTAFGADIVANYDIVGHLHTKVSADVKDATVGKNWYSFLLENLLGGEGGGMADAIIAAMVEKPSTGLVFPDDPNALGWGGNKRHAEILAARLGISGDLPEHFNFPVGTMFWARVAKLRPLFDLGMSWDDYPEEPLPYDGSILHAIERILPLLSVKDGYGCAVTNVPRITR